MDVERAVAPTTPLISPVHWLPAAEAPMTTDLVILPILANVSEIAIEVVRCCSSDYRVILTKPDSVDRYVYAQSFGRGFLHSYSLYAPGEPRNALARICVTPGACCGIPAVRKIECPPGSEVALADMKSEGYTHQHRPVFYTAYFGKSKSMLRLIKGEYYEDSGLANSEILDFFPSYHKFQISIPNNVKLRSIAWSKMDGFIACGGEEGMLKVLKLETGGSDVKGIAAPSNLSVNQNLEGHGGTIQVVVWNSRHQKLTSSDHQGLIIVWMMHKGSWYEEMINNRNKSVVTDMAWDNMGEKICIVYEDGVVIVGSVDGNRLWGKEVKGNLTAVEWSPCSSFLLFGFSTGHVQTYDSKGEPLGQVRIFGVDFDVRTISESEENGPIAIEWHADSRGLPSLAVVFAYGLVQLMRSENDPDPIIFQSEDTEFVDAAWNSNGSLLAVPGKIRTAEEGGEKNFVYFITPFGEHLRTLKIPGHDIAGCSWEASGLRIALAVDSHIFFANIRPRYKWGYCGQTVVYSYEKSDKADIGIMFWDTKLDEVRSRSVHELYGVCSHGNYCAIGYRTDIHKTMYKIELCNSIGTPVDSIETELEPVHMVMNATHVILASRDAYQVWQFNLPKHNLRDVEAAMVKKKETVIIQIDDAIPAKPHMAVHDPISAIEVNRKAMVIARESGTIQIYTLPNFEAYEKYSVPFKPIRIALNKTNKFLRNSRYSWKNFAISFFRKLAIVDMVGHFTLFDFETGALVEKFERKDVWDFKWDEDNEDMVAIMEKTRMYVLNGTEADEPVVSAGYICQFKDLTVKTVLLDVLVSQPESPQKDLLTDIETKLLKEAKQILQDMSINEAVAYIDKNPQPKLWSLLAEVALENANIDIAENAFVHLQDYAGIQFIKKIRNIQNEQLRKAEIAAYFGRFDEAEGIYLSCDRRDLAVGLRSKLGDWFQVLKLFQKDATPGNDQEMERAVNAVGDYYADRHKWRQAAQHYDKGQDVLGLKDAFYMIEDYDALEGLMKSLPEGHALLPEIGEIFANAGLCDPAVESFTKCDQIRSALDTCIQLNHWETASLLAHEHEIPDVDLLLEKYAAQLLADPERQLTTVQLYKKAGQYLHAAKIVFTLADSYRVAKAKPLFLKKIYVLAALLIEDYHKLNKERASDGKHGRSEAQAALSGLLRSDAVDPNDAKLLDNAWRGAEAYHFLLLAQSQLYAGNVDQAMKTALHLIEYEDIIDSVEAYSLLAAAACANRQFSVCSRALIRLESHEAIDDSQRQQYEKMALNVFTKYPPKDTKPTKSECTGCEAMIPDYSQVCPSCETRFPTCIVSGKPLIDYQFWLCPVCKHRAFEQEIVNAAFCPLCHAVIA